jgi:hypothetical protein
VLEFYGVSVLQARARGNRSSETTQVSSIYDGVSLEMIERVAFQRRTQMLKAFDEKMNADHVCTRRETFWSSEEYRCSICGKLDD